MTPSTPLIHRLIVSRIPRFLIVALTLVTGVALVSALLASDQARAASTPDAKPADGSVKIEVTAPDANAKQEKDAGKETPKIELAPGGEAKPDERAAARPRFRHVPGFFEDDEDLFGGDPFELMRRMQEDMDRVFDINRRALGRSRGVPNVAGATMRGDLKVDMKEEGESLVIRCAMPGLDKSSIKVRLKDGLFSVTGETNSNVEEKGDNYYRRELNVGSVSRTVPLPVKVDEKKAKAKYENGILTVTVPKVAGPPETDGAIPVE